MNNDLYLLGASAAKWPPNAIAQEYSNNFKWTEGRRLPDEAKAVHIACKSALRNAGFSAERCLGDRVGIVLGGGFGGFASYERFRSGLGNAGELQPLAFSFSLPCIPASVLSLYYGITGPVISLSTAVETGATSVLDTAIDLLQSGMCDRVVSGTWYFPSDTALKCTGITQAMVSIVVLSTQFEQQGGMVKVEGSKTMPLLYEFLSFRSGFYTDDSQSISIDGDVLMKTVRSC